MQHRVGEHVTYQKKLQLAMLGVIALACVLPMGCKQNNDVELIESNEKQAVDSSDKELRRVEEDDLVSVAKLFLKYGHFPPVIQINPIFENTPTTYQVSEHRMNVLGVERESESSQIQARGSAITAICSGAPQRMALHRLGVASLDYDHQGHILATYLEVFEDRNRNARVEQSERIINLELPSGEFPALISIWKNHLAYYDLVSKDLWVLDDSDEDGIGDTKRVRPFANFHVFGCSAETLNCIRFHVPTVAEFGRMTDGEFAFEFALVDRDGDGRADFIDQGLSWAGGIHIAPLRANSKKLYVSTVNVDSETVRALDDRNKEIARGLVRGARTWNGRIIAKLEARSPFNSGTHIRASTDFSGNWVPHTYVAASSNPCIGRVTPSMIDSWDEKSIVTVEGYFFTEGCKARLLKDGEHNLDCSVEFVSDEMIRVTIPKLGKDWPLGEAVLVVGEDTDLDNLPDLGIWRLRVR